MNDTMKNVMIGIFVVSALIITVSFILFLEPHVGDMGKTLEVRFSNISGINDGTRVTFAGRPVGEVTKILEVPHARDEKADSLGRLYYYQLTLKIDSSVRVFTSDEITVSTIGLMGEKTVSIIPKAPPKGTHPVLVTDQILFARSVDPVENALKKIANVSEKIQELVTNFDDWFTENEDDLSKSVSGFASVMGELDEVLASVNKEELVAVITDTVEVLKSDLELINQMLADAKETDLMGKVGNAFDNFNEAMDAFNVDGKQILSNLNVITQDIRDGSGTIGKLITSDDLYLRVTSLMSKANTLMNDLNHYGLLFQYDKHWQRMRTKRANLLDALDTPKEFRSYFEAEVDQINTSISRLSMLMEKADESEERKQIMESKTFKKDFSQLLREVNGLSDSIKLYNQGLIDTAQEDCD